MKREEFPSCCTTHVLVGLGASQNQDGDARRVNYERNLSEFVNEFHRRMVYEVQCRKAMLTAVTTDQQALACTAMRALGWRCGPWAASGAHKNTKTRLWYWLVQDGVPDLVTTRNKLGLTNS